MATQFLPEEEKALPKEHTFLPKDLPEELPVHATQGKQESADQQYDLPTVKTILSWQAPGRPFRKRSQQYYASVILIALLFVIIAFLFHEYLLMMVIAALVLLNFALVTVPPHNFHYRISTEGITIEDHMYLWQELYDFYFSKKEGIDVLHVRTAALIPGELTLTLGPIDRHHAQSALLPFLPYREVVGKTFMEKSGDWLSKNFPLEPQSHHTD